MFFFWKSIDIACFPSYTEGFGLSVARQWLRECQRCLYESGLYKPWQEQVSLFQWRRRSFGTFTQNLLDDGDLRLRYQRLAYERAQNFTKESMVEGVTSVYREILSSSL